MIIVNVNVIKTSMSKDALRHIMIDQFICVMHAWD